ncbi:hypothetical protein IAD21_03080 [Abditibacteriota bacterium]|nr:hypothetical protein IAD21_03080 [Abditibacteriota bacterium]
MKNRPISSRQIARSLFRLRAAYLALFLCFFGALTAAFSPSAHAQNTNFLSDNGDVLTDGDDFYYQRFVINNPTTFDLRYTPDYTSDCVILAPNYLNAFASGGAYRYFEGFDGRYGTKRFTLAAGTYYVAIRNEVEARNNFSYELDVALTSVPSDNNGTYEFSRWGISGARYVAANGGILYHGFTTTSTERAFLDGCNSGLETYVIPSNQLNNVLGGRSFTYYTAYSGDGAALPGFIEVTLPVGSYYLVFINKSTIQKSVTYQMEYWKRINTLYLDMQAPASWNLSGNYVTMNVAKILNTSTTTTSGSLRLSLWALQSPYDGNANSGVNMGNLDLSPLPARYQYSNISSTVPAVRPSGTYYTAFLLNEWTGSAWRVVDWVNLSSRVTFDARGTRAIGGDETSSFVATGAPKPDASITPSPLPASRSTAALSTSRASGSVGNVTQDTTVSAPPTTGGTLNADTLVGKGKVKAKPGTSSPNPSASSS